jgi:hypothetical protein
MAQELCVHVGAENLEEREAIEKRVARRKFTPSHARIAERVGYFVFDYPVAVRT